MAFRRESTMPMDYEWENKQGPVDLKSPFMNIPTNTNNTVKKRPHSVLDSPSKGFSTPNRPQLREPNSQHFLFSQNDSKPLPAVPSHVSDSRLWEPRTPTSVIDFSSGGETPNTPYADDSEATPETGLRQKMSRMLNDGIEGRKSPKKNSRRESWLGALFSKSPAGKGDSRTSHYSNKAENRVIKRRQKKALVRAAEEEADYSDNDTDRAIRPRRKASKKDDTADNTNIPPSQATAPPPSSIAAFFSFLETHPGLPHILSWYLQLILNIFLVFSAIYILYSFWHAITSEVDLQARKSMSQIMQEIATCARNYEDNRCDRATRVPAMENACANWESCMQRDPKKVARASVTARTFAMIFNSFVEEFSYKAMIFTALIIFGGFNLSNWAFGLLRAKQPAPHPHDSYYPPPPATPARYPSNGYLDQGAYYAPYASGVPAGAIEGQGAAGGAEEGSKGGVRKLMFK